MTEREAAALRCGLKLLEHRFRPYAEAVLRDCGGQAAMPALKLLEQKAPDRAMTSIREALAENG
jgi:hypothetical protein